MAASYRNKTAGRAATAVRAIRDFLRAGDSNAALTEATRKIRSEAAHVRRRRPNDGPLIDAYAAGLVTGAAALLPDYPPPRPEGCTGRPGPDDLLAVFAAGLDKASEFLSEGETQ